MPHRLLFASIHSYLDHSSGAALATRDLLELLAAHGWDCRALTCGVLDYEQETPLEDVLAALERPTSRVGAALSRGGEAEVCDLELDGVRVTLMPTAHSRVERAPSPREAGIFLDLAEQVLERFRPQVLLTYGGQPACLELMHKARARKIPVVFHMHNFAYVDRGGFADVSAVLVPTEYSRRLYARRLGLDCTHIPLPLNPRRVIAAEPEPRYVTFVNPQLLKGAAVVARIATELSRRRPEIPFLIVDGRAGADDMGKLALDLSDLKNLNRMANTPDPRDFYRVSRILLVPDRKRGAGGAGGAGQWHSRARQRPGRAARDPGRRRLRLHAARSSLHAGQPCRADGARSGSLGGDDRAALGRSGLRSPSSRTCEGGSRAVGRRPAGGAIREALRDLKITISPCQVRKPRALSSFPRPRSGDGGRRPGEEVASISDTSATAWRLAFSPKRETHTMGASHPTMQEVPSR